MARRKEISARAVGELAATDRSRDRKRQLDGPGMQGSGNRGADVFPLAQGVWAGYRSTRRNGRRSLSRRARSCGPLQSIIQIMLGAFSFAIAPLLAMALASNAAAQQATVPFQLQDNLIRVPVQLNGRSVEAVLDSGTGGLVIDRAFAASLGLHSGASTGKAVGGGAPEPIYPVTIGNLDFGPEPMKSVSAFALNLDNLSSSAGFPVRVILGHPVFMKRAVLINYPARDVVFFPVGVEPPCTDPIPLTFLDGVPVVTATLRATATSLPVKLRLIVDLGTRQFAAMLGGPYLNSSDGKKLEKLGHSMQVGTGTGGVIMGRSVSVDDLTVGSHHFRDLGIALTRHNGAFVKGVVDGSLGVPLWKRGTIIFDDAHQRLCLNVPQATTK